MAQTQTNSLKAVDAKNAKKYNLPLTKAGWLKKPKLHTEHLTLKHLSIEDLYSVNTLCKDYLSSKPSVPFMCVKVNFTKIIKNNVKVWLIKLIASSMYASPTNSGHISFNNFYHSDEAAQNCRNRFMRALQSAVNQEIFTRENNNE